MLNRRGVCFGILGAVLRGTLLLRMLLLCRREGGSGGGRGFNGWWPLRCICSSGRGLAGGLLVVALLAVISVDKLEVINFIMCSRPWPLLRREGGSGGGRGFVGC